MITTHLFQSQLKGKNTFTITFLRPSKPFTGNSSFEFGPKSTKQQNNTVEKGILRQCVYEMRLNVDELADQMGRDVASMIARLDLCVCRQRHWRPKLQVFLCHKKYLPRPRHLPVKVVAGTCYVQLKFHFFSYFYDNQTTLSTIMHCNVTMVNFFLDEKLSSLKE